MELEPERGVSLLLVASFGLEFRRVCHAEVSTVAHVNRDDVQQRDAATPPWSMVLGHAQMFDAIIFDESRGQLREVIVSAFVHHWFGLLAGTLDPAFAAAFPGYCAWFATARRQALTSR